MTIIATRRINAGFASRFTRKGIKLVTRQGRKVGKVDWKGKVKPDMHCSNCGDDLG